MSLFENSLYQWRETYFVLFEKERRPQADELAEELARLGPGYVIDNLQADENGAFEALTLHSPLDNAAMDITYIDGDEVVEQVRDLVRELRESSLTAEERAKARRLASANARFDLFHFEQIGDAGLDDDEEAMDPGSLLLVLERLAHLSDGVCIDPQTGSVI
jgi:hypothetical protein